jgi:ParB-like nuclease domain
MNETIKAVISTNPKNFGADVQDDGKGGESVVSIPLSQIVPFEPAEKMNLPASKKNMLNIAKAIRLGHKIKPILVRKDNNGYIVVDGHHRYFAAKIAGSKTIQAKIIQPKNVEIKKENASLLYAEIGSPEWFSFMMNRVT